MPGRSMRDEAGKTVRSVEDARAGYNKPCVCWLILHRSADSSRWNSKHVLPPCVLSQLYPCIFSFRGLPLLADRQSVLVVSTLHHLTHSAAR